MKQKKGQAALEYMSTYGWALMAVLIAIGAIMIYGINSPDTLASERCVPSQGFGCSSFDLVQREDDGLRVNVRNNLGYEIEINETSFNVLEEGVGITQDCVYSFTQEVTTRGLMQINCSSPIFGSIERNTLRKFVVEFDYYRSSSGPDFTRTASFEVLARARLDS